MQHAYPENVARIMAGQIFNLRRVVGHHFKRRANPDNRHAVRAWVAELRRIDRASGYSHAVRQSGLAMPAYR